MNLRLVLIKTFSGNKKIHLNTILQQKNFVREYYEELKDREA